MHSQVRAFYELFVTALYGFVMVIGFQNFLLIRNTHTLGLITYSLLAAAYITTLHFWIVYFAATGDTFILISGRDRPHSHQMLWFWVELIFATALAIPMLDMFSSINDVAKFSHSMALIAAISLLWDFWAFSVDYVTGHDKGGARAWKYSPSLWSWIGLDILFLILIIIVCTVLRYNHQAVVQFLGALFLLAIAIIGAVLDTVLINPLVYLRKRT